MEASRKIQLVVEGEMIDSKKSPKRGKET